MAALLLNWEGESVAELLGFLMASLLLELVDLLRLEMAVLLLNWKKEDIGELLPVPVHVVDAYQPLLSVTMAGCFSSRTDHRSLWAAPCSS